MTERSDEHGNRLEPRHHVGLGREDADQPAAVWLSRLPWDDTGQALDEMSASRLLGLL